MYIIKQDRRGYASQVTEIQLAVKILAQKLPRIPESEGLWQQSEQTFELEIHRFRGASK